jgi:hypothetical protein
LAVSSDSGLVGDNITRISTPTINGTGTVGDTIQLKEGNVVLGTAIVGSDGKWSIVSSELSNGSHSLIAIASDIAGNISSTSTPLNLIIDTTITTPSNLTLAVGSDSGVVGDNITLISTPNITGTGNVGDTIQLKEGDNLLGTGIVGSDGTWEIVSSQLTNGTHSLTAIASDIDGNLSANSTALNITVDTLAPTLTLSAPLTNAILVNNSVLAGLVTESGSNLASINYQWDNSANAIAVTPDAAGNFNQSLDFTGINNGSHTLTITAVDGLSR